MLVGFIQLRTVGEDLVLYLRMQIQQLSVLIRSHCTTNPGTILDVAGDVNVSAL